MAGGSTFLRKEEELGGVGEELELGGGCRLKPEELGLPLRPERPLQECLHSNPNWGSLQTSVTLPRLQVTSRSWLGIC